MPYSDEPQTQLPFAEGRSQRGAERNRSSAPLELGATCSFLNALWSDAILASKNSACPSAFTCSSVLWLQWGRMESGNGKRMVWLKCTWVLEKSDSPHCITKCVSFSLFYPALRISKEFFFSIYYDGSKMTCAWTQEVTRTLFMIRDIFSERLVGVGFRGLNKFSCGSVIGEDFSFYTWSFACSGAVTHTHTHTR